MKTTVKNVTPQWASQILETRNPKNRPVSQMVVNAYAADMSSHHWLMTHQGIAFNESGDLIDGQHRLHAVVKSGKTIAMVVTTGIPAVQKNGLSLATMDVVDRHRARGIGQQLGLSHGWANGNRVAALARGIALFYNAEPAAKIKLTMPQTLDILNGCDSEVRRVMKIAFLNQSRAHSKVLSAVAIYASKFPGKAEAFLQTYLTTIGWTSGCLQKALDAWVRHNRIAMNSSDACAVMAVAAALYYYHRGETLQILRVNQKATDWLLDLNPELQKAVLTTLCK